jgi:hypothetical protein
MFHVPRSTEEIAGNSGMHAATARNEMIPVIHHQCCLMHKPMADSSLPSQFIS